MKDCKTILQLSTEFLSKYRLKKPRLTAEILLAHFLGMKRIELYMHFDRPLLEEELASYREALKRAAQQEPIEYILGEMEFYHVKIKVSPDVLIPRQETEILLDLVCKRLQGDEKKVLDLCTGSGCLAAALKKARSDLEVFGVDLSEKALAIARQNSSEVYWLCGDLTMPVREEKFDVVICNPPYVAEQEYPELEKSVRDFEPKMALVSGPTGVEFYERLSIELPSILNPGAKVFFEIGAGQGEMIQKIFSMGPWEALELQKENSLIMQ
jgi:release factor glutamine methyltransferase